MNLEEIKKLMKTINPKEWEFNVITVGHCANCGCEAWRKEDAEFISKCPEIIDLLIKRVELLEKFVPKVPDDDELWEDDWM